MANAFSSKEFMGAAADAMFSGRAWRREIVEVDGARFALLSVDGRIVPVIPFFDFWEPVEDGERSDRKIDYLPNVCVDRVDTETWQAGGQGDLRASPLIDWTRFGSFADFQAFARGRHWQAFEKSGRKAKKLKKEVGELRFVDSDARDELMRACMSWKSSQYRASGLVDVLESDRQKRLFFNLRERGFLQVSALYAGDRLAAVHMNALKDGRLYYWVPAHDPELSKYSVGTLLLEHVMKQSYEAGHTEFDFLIGSEEYKFRYATDVRRIGNRGRPPLWRRVWVPLRARLVEQTSKHEALHGHLQALKRELLRRRLR